MPLVISVVGHRDLIAEDLPRLRKQVEQIFQDLEKYYPSSKPFQLLSGLAEGGDRLVARIALRRGAQLIACLPMKRVFYETDFEPQSSRREFNDLLADAFRTIELAWVPGNSAENINYQSNRDLQYDSLGKYLVDHCQILIALWDGVENSLLGGTSAVVSRQLYGPWGKNGIDPANPLPFPDTGPVFHVLTPRLKNPAPAGDLQDRHLLFPTGFEIGAKIKKCYGKFFFQRPNLFNADRQRIGKHDRPLLARNKDWLLPKKDRQRLDPSMQQLIERYAEADWLALSYKKKTKHAFRTMIFVLGLGGVLSFELFAHGSDAIQTITLLAYLSIIVLAFVVYRRNTRRDIKTRHLDYRALAEGLRLQIFWKLAGLKDSVADHYLTKQRTELSWVRDAIRRWSRSVPSLATPNWEFVGIHWIRNQFDFFTRKAKDNREAEHREHFAYWCLVLVVFAMGMATFFIYALNPWGLYASFHHNSLGGFEWHGLLVILMTMLPAIAAAITAYSIKMAHAEERRQYERMRELYQRGLSCFETATRMEKPPNENQFRQKVVFQLGEEALSENADWVLMHRERNVEMFIGG